MIWQWPTFKKAGPLMIGRNRIYESKCGCTQKNGPFWSLVDKVAND
jgi:hypothetical protein